MSWSRPSWALLVFEPALELVVGEFERDVGLAVPAAREQGGDVFEVRVAHGLLGGLVLVALAHLRRVEIEDEGHVRVDGGVVAEGLLEGDMPGRVVEVFLAPQDVGDAHERIVDDDGEVVGGEAVLLADDEVVEFGVGESHVAQDLVVDGDVALGEPEAEDVGLDLGARGRRCGRSRAPGGR